MKKNVKLLLGFCASLALLASCNTIQVSKGPQGLVPEGTVCMVINTILPESDPNYETYQDCTGWVSVSPERLQQLQSDWNDLAAKYLKCRKDPKNCK